MPDQLGPDPVAASTAEYGFPGPQRDQLVTAIVNGQKTATSSLVDEYVRGGELLPKVGDLEVVLDSEEQPVCVTRNVSVQIKGFSDVGDSHAIAEGEGLAGASAWRTKHRAFWASPEFVEAVGKPELTIDDDTSVVLVEFEVLARL